MVAVTAGRQVQTGPGAGQPLLGAEAERAVCAALYPGDPMAHGTPVFVREALAALEPYVAALVTEACAVERQRTAQEVAEISSGAEGPSVRAWLRCRRLAAQRRRVQADQVAVRNQERDRSDEDDQQEIQGR